MVLENQIQLEEKKKTNKPQTEQSHKVLYFTMVLKNIYSYACEYQMRLRIHFL